MYFLQKETVLQISNFSKILVEKELPFPMIFRLCTAHFFTFEISHRIESSLTCTNCQYFPKYSSHNFEPSKSR